MKMSSVKKHKICHLPLKQILVSPLVQSDFQQNMQ